MRQAVFLLGCFLGLASPAWAANEATPAQTPIPSPYAYLEKWVGSYPTLEKDGKQPLPKGQTLWDDPRFMGSLKAYLAPKLAADMAGCWKRECQKEPIQKLGDYLIVLQRYADPKDRCVFHEATMLFNLKTGASRICWVYMGPTDDGCLPGHLWWTGANEMAGLGNNGCTLGKISSYLLSEQQGKIVGTPLDEKRRNTRTRK